tara:strand:- start:2162 stop:2734 length:573 start_codon:yes stop_codon:yes gene_type:complete
MVWKYKSKEIAGGRTWKDDDGIQHPPNWMIWSDATKKNKGLTWTDDPAPFDNNFYWGYQVDGKTLIERKVADEDAVDGSGNKLKDEDGNQVINEGLKTIWVRQTKERANGRLTKSDWYVTRKAEAGTAIPSDITTYRTAVRTASKTIEDKINACSDLAAFKALFDIPVDSDGKATGNAPIYNFPKEVTND